MALADQYASQAEALAKSIEGIGVASRTSGQEMQSLSDKVLTLGKVFGTWATIEVAKSLFHHAIERLKTQRDNYHIVAKEHDLQIEMVRQAERQLLAAKSAVNVDKTVVQLAEERLDQAGKMRASLFDQLKVHTEVVRLYERHHVSATVSLAVLSATATMWAATVRSAAELNRALMQTTLDTQKRYDLIRRTLEVQGQLGASTSTMAEAAHAMAEYGHDLTSAYSENLKLVVMLRDGLGVAASTSAEMVTIFSRQLHASVEKVGDAIARVTEQTGLAAERMAQFAIETAKALRLLGPGLGAQSERITEQIGMLSGRIKQLGGEERIAADVLRRLTGGGSDSYTLRALARTNPSDLRSEQGVNQAMKNLSGFIRSMVPANAMDPSYPARLQAASELTGIAVDQIETFNEAVAKMGRNARDANMAGQADQLAGAVDGVGKSASSSRTLLEAYSRQQTLLGNTFAQIKESTMAIIKQALLPLLEVFNPMMRELADLVKALSTSKTLIYSLRIAIPIAAGIAVVALTRLTWAIGRLAFTSEVGGKMLGSYVPGGGKMLGMARQLPNWWQYARYGAIGPQLPGFPGAAAPSLAARLATPLSGSAAALGGGAAGWLGTGAAVLGAGVAGYGIGRVVDNLMDRMPRWTQLLHPLGQLKFISTKLGEWSADWKQSQMKAFAYRRSDGIAAVEAAEAAAHAVAQYVLTGKNDPRSKVIEATKAAEKAFGPPGIQSAWKGIESRAKLEVVHTIKRSQLAGPTIKTTEDRNLDARFEQLLRANNLDEQLRVLTRIQESSKTSAEAAKQTVDTQREAAKANSWQSIDSPHTNSPAYKR